MVLPRHFILAAVLIALPACRTKPTSAIDPDLASYVPEGAIALGAIDLAQLRASPVYAKLPSSAASFLAPLAAASRTLFAYTPQGLLLVALGDFSQLPSGAVLDGRRIALAGAPELIQKAIAQHQRHSVGAPDLLSHVDAAAAAHTFWFIVSGRSDLPLSGNAANLNRFLHLTDYTTIAAQFSSAVDMEITAVCPDANHAGNFEESLRAIVSLASARSSKSTALDSVRIQRDQATVKVILSADPADLARLF
jgi:hypothetical protein